MEHRRIVAYLWTLRLPFWALAVLSTTVKAWAPEVAQLLPFPGAEAGAQVDSFLKPSLAASFVGVQLGEALAVWSLLMVPLAVPVLYFFGGIVAHLCMAMTGPMTRSIGASMRVFGLASSVPLLVGGLVDLLFIWGELSPEAWLFWNVPGSVMAGLVMAIGLARSHDAPLVRGYVAATIPHLVLLSCLLARDTLMVRELPWSSSSEATGRRSVPLLPPPR